MQKGAAVFLICMTGILGYFSNSVMKINMTMWQFWFCIMPISLILGILAALMFISKPK